MNNAQTVFVAWAVVSLLWGILVELHYIRKALGSK